MIPTIGQIYRDSNVHPRVRFLENFIPGRSLTFNKNINYYTFQNYSLTHANSEINTLSPNLANMTAHFYALNFQALTHLFPATDMSFEDLNSLLGIIRERNVIRNQLSSFSSSIDDTNEISTADSKVLINSPGATYVKKRVFPNDIFNCEAVISGILSLLFILKLT